MLLLSLLLPLLALGLVPKLTGVLTAALRPALGARVAH
jgi:hypothetical protein